MNKLILILIICSTLSCSSEKNKDKSEVIEESLILQDFTEEEIIEEDGNWQDFSEEDVQSIRIDTTQKYVIGEFVFDAYWDEKLSYSENLGNYGGIEKLVIYRKEKQLQTIINIEDGIALGDILFEFYDYNFDGYLDFTIPIDCGKSCYEKYYLFNPESNQFIHKKDWDYLRIKKIDKKNKLILNVPEGNASQSTQKTYKVIGMDLILEMTKNFN
jgi:hypothetical protein